MDNNPLNLDSPKPFEWTPTKRQAAFHLALGQDPKSMIARKLQVHPKTISYWEKAPEFQAQVKEFRDRILLTTDEQLTRTLSEQIINMRTALNVKLKSVAELKKIPTERLLAEYRKFVETIFKVNKGGEVHRHEGDLNVHYGGKIQIEDLLKDVDGDSRELVQSRLLQIAEEVVADREKEILGEGGELEFPGGPKK